MSDPKPRLLLVDDDDDIRSQMKWALNSDFEIHLAEDAASAKETFSRVQPVVTLLDLGLPPRPNEPVEGLSALRELLNINPHAKIIIVSGQSEKQNALQAISQGAYDFLTKPVDMQELQIILRRAFHVASLESENRALRNSLHANAQFEGMIGSSPQMQQIFATIRKVATTDAPVLLLGASGTGKEMVANAIHRNSNRKDKPFVAINCGAIPENLIESELFGHEKGAFTGAHAQRKGRIEMAEGGTLFLDEIGELPMQLQVKLLRFLQEQTIERVGGRSQIQIDTRVIAATNVDLQLAQTEGRFREDLYYRLAVVVLRLPPLVERTNDLVLLAKSFIKKFSDNKKKEVKFSPQAIAAMQSHSWPGNVRELENRVRRAMIMAEGGTITPSDLELDSPALTANPKGLKEARDEMEREMINLAMQRHKGKITAVALDLGISRPTLYELMQKLGIQRPQKD